MATKIELIRKLRSPDNHVVLTAIQELRVQDWLEEGALVNLPLCHVHMNGADLTAANLSGVDFHQAQLQRADLSGANLRGAKLTRTQLQGANFKNADLRGADLFKSNLAEARNLTPEQLAQASRLFGAIMPDNAPYDGRYSLPGDIEFARWGGVDISDPQALANFFGVPLHTYLAGQQAQAETA